MTYEFYRIEFSFNKNGNFIVKYDGKLLRRPQLIQACEDALFSLDCRIVYSNSDYGTHLAMSNFVPRGFTYKELKALLLVTIHNWFCVLPVDDNKLSALSAILSRLETDRSRYMGHIPSAIIYTDVKKDLEIDCVLVSNACTPLHMYVCCVYGHAFCSSNLLGLENHIKNSVPSLTKKYNIILKVRE